MSCLNQSYLDTIGNTPMVRLDRVLPAAVKAQGTIVMAKMEMQNPGGSVKDRIAMSMIEAAEKSGALKPGMTVVEYTSGNTGIGLAMVCAAKGYKCILCMPQLASFLERYIVCRQFGAEVHLTAPAKGLPGLKVYAEKLLAEHPEYFCTNQFGNDANPQAHFDTTGPEIVAQAGVPDYFICGVGTGGTLNGIGKYLAGLNPAVKIIAVEPTESRTLMGGTHHPHTIMGIGSGVIPVFIESLAPGQAMAEGPRGIITEFLSASSNESIEWCARMTKEEGMMVGPSSGGAIKVAMEVAARPEAAGKVIVVLLASHGIRYTAHPMWAQIKAEAAAALPLRPNTKKDAPLLLWKSETFVSAL